MSGSYAAPRAQSLDGPLGRSKSIQMNSHTCPDAPRCSRHHAVFVGPVIWVDAQRAVWVVRVRRQEPGTIVILVQRIHDAREDFEVLVEAISSIEVQQRIARDPACSGGRDIGA